MELGSNEYIESMGQRVDRCAAFTFVNFLYTCMYVCQTLGSRGVPHDRSSWVMTLSVTAKDAETFLIGRQLWLRIGLRH